MDLKTAFLFLSLAAVLGLAARLTAIRLTGQCQTFSHPVAAATGLAMCLSTWPAPPSPLAAAVDSALGWALLSLAMADVAALRLPDGLTLPLIVAGLLSVVLPAGTQPFTASLDARVIGAGVGYLALAGLARAYRSARGREGLGLGDAKLAAVAGAWLGWRMLPSVILAACVLALIWVAARFLRRGPASLAAPLPFGAPLSLAIWLVWVAPSGLRGALTGFS